MVTQMLYLLLSSRHQNIFTRLPISRSHDSPCNHTGNPSVVGSSAAASRDDVLDFQPHSSHHVRPTDPHARTSIRERSDTRVQFDRSVVM